MNHIRRSKSIGDSGIAQTVRCCSFHGSARFLHAGPHHSFLRREVASPPSDWFKVDRARTMDCLVDKQTRRGLLTTKGRMARCSTRCNKKALDLTIPASLLARADEVIE